MKSINKILLFSTLAISSFYLTGCKKNKGCTDSTAVNFNAKAEVDDGTCKYAKLGCTDVNALNYDAFADHDNGTCTYPAGYVPGSASPGNGGNGSGGGGSLGFPKQEQKTILYMYTATWCHSCGSWGDPAFETFLTQEPAIKCFTVQTNDDLTGTTDPYRAWLDQYWPYGGTPNFVVGDSAVETNYYAAANIISATNGAAPIANAAISSTIEAGKIKIKGNMMMFEDGGTDEFYVAVYILEDGIVKQQTLDNGGSDPNRIHNRVLREAMEGKPEGVLIGSNLHKNDLKSFQGSITIDPTWVMANTRLIAIVWRKSADGFHFVNVS